MLRWFVSVKNIPYRIFNDEQFFKKIILPYELIFKTNLNSKNIVSNIENVCNEIKKIISKRVENKLISLKVDIATRANRSILGINIQYINNFKICIHTIGMIQLSKKHSAEVLLEEILQCLREYNIDIKQVYSNTTDNGRNVIKASRMLAELQEENAVFNETLEEMSQEFTNENTQDGRQIDLNNTDAIFDDLQMKLSSIFSVVRCAAHTLQLAVHDEMRKLEGSINECRTNVKKIRTLVRGNNVNITLPVIDNTTRWNSTYEMVSSLLKIKDDILNLEGSTIIHVDWNFVTNFVDAFKALAICTKQLQQEQYTLGDFYR